MSQGALAAAMVPPDRLPGPDSRIRRLPTPGLPDHVALLPASERQGQVLARIVRLIAADREIKAAWLAGSLARGDGDAFSDVDVVALVPSGAATRVWEKYARWASRLRRLALVRCKRDSQLINVITGDWDRCDLRFVDEDELCHIDRRSLVPLWGETRALLLTTAETARSGARETVVPQLVREFFRVLGLAVVAVHREEWLLAQSGISMMRQLTIDLLLEDRGLGSDRSGAFHLNVLLSRDQRQALESLPVPAADRSSIIAANVALARMFVPLARELTSRTSCEWPIALEVATYRHLRGHLGVDFGV